MQRKFLTIIIKGSFEFLYTHKNLSFHKPTGNVHPIKLSKHVLDMMISRDFKTNELKTSNLLKRNLAGVFIFKFKFCLSGYKIITIMTKILPLKTQ